MAKNSVDISRILEAIKNLAPQQLRVLRQKIDSLDKIDKMTTGDNDIRKLRGLGKEIWKGLDATEYVKKERDSWD